MKFYLAGSIYIEPDKGAGWREWIILKLEELGYEYSNPLDKPDEGSTIPVIKALKRKGVGARMELQAFCQSKIIRPDLRALDESDGVIALFTIINGKIQWSFGTVSELFYAWQNDKTILMVIPGLTYEIYRDQVSAFAIGTADRIFSSFIDLLDDLDGRVVDSY